jgi:hypothetical protein
MAVDALLSPFYLPVESSATAASSTEAVGDDAAVAAGVEADGDDSSSSSVFMAASSTLLHRPDLFVDPFMRRVAPASVSAVREKAHVAPVVTGPVLGTSPAGHGLLTSVLEYVDYAAATERWAGAHDVDEEEKLGAASPLFVSAASVLWSLPVDRTTTVSSTGSARASVDSGHFEQGDPTQVQEQENDEDEWSEASIAKLQARRQRSSALVPMAPNQVSGASQRETVSGMTAVVETPVLTLERYGKWQNAR